MMRLYQSQQIGRLQKQLKKAIEHVVVENRESLKELAKLMMMKKKKKSSKEEE